MIAMAAPHPFKASHDLREGDFCVVRYAVPGVPLWHERLVSYLPPGYGLVVSILSPDNDDYEEDWGSADIAEWQPLPGR